MKFIHQIDPSKFIFFELSHAPANYLHRSQRAHFFEIIWMKDYKRGEDHSNEEGGYIYFIPPYRSTKPEVEDKNACIIAFDREYLEEDNQEYALDVFNLFNMHGQLSGFAIDRNTAETLQHLTLLIEKEYNNPMGTYLALKALLKVLLLNLIRINQHYFLHQDLNQKRVYQFIMLMDKHYKTERKADFYSNKMGISEKRINQILKEKMNRTLTQLLHERVIVEAKRMLVSCELTIKEIAYHLNFDDPAYFSRFYKKHTGHTPEDFKNQITGV